MPFLKLAMFSALFIVSGMAFQRMLPRNASEFISKDIVKEKTVVLSSNKNPGFLHLIHRLI